MKESSDSSIKNNCLSSGFLKFKGLYNIHDGINGEHKENKDIDNNSAQSKQLSEMHKHKNLNSSLIQFMENQDKKHLSTNFNHKNAEKFLKEKEKAMEEIIFEDEPMIENNESNYDDKEDKNKSVQFKKEKDENKSQYKSNNENNNILIFHGTFGEDKVNEIMKEHHHKHSHHHHHHHHHHHYENENKSKFTFEC